MDQHPTAFRGAIFFVGQCVTEVVLNDPCTIAILLGWNIVVIIIVLVVVLVIIVFVLVVTRDGFDPI